MRQVSASFCLHGNINYPERERERDTHIIIHSTAVPPKNEGKQQQQKTYFFKCHIHMLQNAAACQISVAPQKWKKYQLIINIYNFHIQFFFCTALAAHFGIFSPSSVDSFVRANLCKSIYHSFSKRHKQNRSKTESAMISQVSRVVF